MFKTNSQLKEELQLAQSKIADLEADATAQAAELETAQTELATAREDLTSAQERITELETEATATAEQIETLQTELTEQKEATAAAEDSAGQKAAEEIAKAGHPAVDLDEEAPPLSIRDQYKSMAPGPERKAFRDKHATELENV